jgi:hypothetical protein
MIHYLQCINKDTIPWRKGKSGAGCTLPNFNARMPILKNKALLQLYVIKISIMKINRKSVSKKEKDKKDK